MCFVGHAYTHCVLSTRRSNLLRETTVSDDESFELGKRILAFAVCKKQKKTTAVIKALLVFTRAGGAGAGGDVRVRTAHDIV